MHGWLRPIQSDETAGKPAEEVDLVQVGVARGSGQDLDSSEAVSVQSGK